MLTRAQTEARKLHARLNHPIIDADGHWVEFAPLMREEFRRIGGDTAHLDFFKGTVVEKQAAEVLDKPR